MPNHDFKFGDEGKGSLGCIFALLLMAAAIFLAIKLGPPYVNHFEFGNNLKQTINRASVHEVTDEYIKKNLILDAEKNNIVLTNENIQIRRIAGKIIIRVEYTVPVDFIVIKRELKFRVEEASYTLR